MKDSLPAPRASLLIVDDIPDNVEMLGEALADEYEIHFATSGQEALALAASTRPDLILLDIMMPEMDGYETCRRLRQSPATAGMPVIFVTALNDEAAEMNGLALGAADFLTKPVNIGIARLRIRNLLERERTRHALALALGSARQGLWRWEVQANAVTFDAAWSQPLGYPEGEAPPPGQPWERIAHPRDLPALQAALEAYRSGRQDFFACDVRLRNREDYFTWVHLRGSRDPHRQSTDAMVLYGVLTDIGERKRAERRLQEQEARLSTIIDSMSCSIVAFDTALRIGNLHVAPGQERLFTAQPATENSPLDRCLCPPLAEALTLATLDLIGGERQRRFDFHLPGAAGEAAYRITVSPLTDAEQLPSGFLALIQ